MIAKPTAFILGNGLKSLIMGIFPQKISALLLIITLIPGCARLQPVTPAPSLAGSDFLLQGKLGILAPDGTRGTATTVSLNFRWLQRLDAFDIQFWGPLGQGRSHLSGNAHNVSLTTPDGHTHRDKNVEALMQRWLGWSLPIEVLKYWVQGRPAPFTEATDVARNENNEVTGFRQLDWSLEFSRYRSVDARYLPGRTVARKGPYRLTVVNRHWQSGDSTDG